MARCLLIFGSMNFSQASSIKQLLNLYRFPPGMIDLASGVYAHSWYDPDAYTQEDWALPVNGFARAQRTQSRHTRMAGAIHRRQAAQSTRKLLTPSQQSSLTARGSGMLLYQPTGYQIDGADLTQFFREAHSNHNVTGALFLGSWGIYPNDI